MSGKVILTIVVMAVVVFLTYLFINMLSNKNKFENINNSPMLNHIENFSNVMNAPAEQVYVRSEFEDVPEQQTVSGSEEISYIEQPQSLGSNDTGFQMNQLPSSCFPKDVLSSSDLLPADSNSLWAQVSPSGQGSLADQNFLTSGFHIGINTVGQTLRNANRQLRSEPLNSQVKVSPWMQSTIDPDINRRPLEINSGDL